MLKILVLAFCIFSHISFATELKIEHIANAGVKITSQDQVILIDALFGPHGRFNSLNNTDFNEFIQQEVHIALTTHAHSDHFGKNRTLSFLKQNPNTLFISTPQVIEQIKEQVQTSQLATATLTSFQSKTFIHNNIKITALNFPHMSPHHEKIQNYAYLIDINGWRLLHIGDAEINSNSIKNLTLAQRNIDVLLSHDLLASQPGSLDLIKQMNVDKVVFVHLTNNKAKPLNNWIKQNLPNAAMLVTGYESIHLKK